MKVLDISTKKCYRIAKRQRYRASAASNLNTILSEISVMAKSLIPFQVFQVKQISPANGGVCYG